MAQERVNITSPVGRIVMGSLYRPNDKDFDGKPLTIKTGPNAGQPRVSYFFALAIPKTGEQHWAQTAWGSKIWEVGHRAFPQAAQRPDFAWKIDDGDSQVPNKKNRRPCDNEGWPGHWILKLSGGFAPKVYRQEGAGYVQVLEEDYVKPGYYVEAAFNVDSNAQQSNPGVYLNHSMVCFRAFGPEIAFGPNVEEAGFGQNPLPAGASLTPLASSIPLPGMPPAGAPPAHSMPQAPPMPPAAYPSSQAPPMPPLVPVYPNTGFVQMPPPAGSAYPAPPIPQQAAGNGPGAYMPAAGATPAPPANAYPSNPAAPPAPAYKMTAKANGASREAFLQGGWTDAMLIQQGFMTA